VKQKNTGATLKLAIFGSKKLKGGSALSLLYRQSRDGLEALPMTFESDPV